MPSFRVAAVALALAFVVASLVAAPAGAQSPVIAANAVSERVSDRIEALGTLRANEAAQLTATVTETVSEVRFTDGQRVSAGDVLVTMTNREQLAELAAAEADVEEARQQFRRASDLAETRSEAEAVLDQRRRELSTAEARLRGVQARLADRLIVAPFDGVVGLRSVSAGSLMTPGTVVTTLVDDSVMKLDFSVPERYLAQLVPGLTLTARTAAYPDETFEAELESVDNVVDPVSRSIRVRALLPNPDRRLRPGMLMTVTMDTRTREATVIPEEALVPQGRDNFVFVVDASSDTAVAERRQVSIGTRRAGFVEIRDGVQPGETVVTHGGFLLSDGARVRILAIADEHTSIPDVLAGRHQ